jgi:hypothetical protein
VPFKTGLTWHRAVTSSQAYKKNRQKNPSTQCINSAGDRQNQKPPTPEPLLCCDGLKYEPTNFTEPPSIVTMGLGV